LPARSAETYTAHSTAISAAQFNKVHLPPCIAVPSISLASASDKRCSLGFAYSCPLGDSMVRQVTLHFVYLVPEVKSQKWEHLHRFLNPGAMEHDQQVMLICRDLDISHHIFVSLRARDWTVPSGGQVLLLRYDLVALALEVRSRTNPLGFVDLDAVREELAEGSGE
jgi:hypothetical protein